MKAPLTFLSVLLLPFVVNAEQSADDLSAQATDPTAALMAMNFSATYTGGFHGNSAGLTDDAWDAKFQPVIPFQFLDHANILRMTVPYQLSGRGDEGFEPLSVFDLFLVDKTWGLGPLVSVDPCGSQPDRVTAGPAVGIVRPVSRQLKVGLFSQNLFGQHTAISQLQPILAYQLGHGWSLSSGDLQFSYDWKAARWLSAPVGFQIGKVTRLGRQPVRLAINPQYNLINRDGLNEWSLTFTFAALFPVH